jgi:uncharacterized SAM-binding protein YcdF (DUF218 family)
MRHIFLWAFVAAILLFVFGFWRFAESVRGSADNEAPPHAQAIVVLTGAPERLDTAVRLLEQQRADRLLISGVNRIVTDGELYHALNVDPSVGECCIDVGRSAEDTLGNASETAAWAREHRYTDIILVTDDYHMPRSQAELAVALPEATIHPYPVRTRWTDPALWRSDLGAASRLGAEYVKYLVIRGREALIGLGSNDAEPQPDDA